MTQGKHDDCHVEPVQKQASPEEAAQTAEAWLLVWGMGCPNCANRVRNSLLATRGVVEAYVDHLSGRALVRYNPAMVSPKALQDAVRQAGGDGRHEYFARLVG